MGRYRISLVHKGLVHPPMELNMLPDELNHYIAWVLTHKLRFGVDIERIA